MQMGAAAKTNSQNSLGKKKKRLQGVKKGQNKNRPPSLFANISRPPFPLPGTGMVRGMRRPPPFPPGRMHPGMRPIPPPGPAMRGPMPPPLMRGPPGRIPPPPPMGMRPPPGVRPPPMMRPMPPPMMPPMGAPRPFGPTGGPVPLMGVPPRGRMGNRSGMKGKKFNKKKNSKNGSNEEADLKKPWVTDEIKSEYSKKQDLLKAARESKKKEDWDSYKEQREKCFKMFNAAKLEYIGKHPEEVHLYCENEDDCNFEDNEEFFCETCDREFDSIDDWEEHEMQHQICGIDGCTFNAHFKVITKHIQMQHSSGLYEKINIKNTPEDIAKWREERRNRYPTKQNIEEQEKRKNEMIERGEKLGQKKRKFECKKEIDQRRREWNKDRKDRYSKSKCENTKVKKKLNHNKKFPKLDIEDEKSTWNGSVHPFKGTKLLYENETIATELDIDDTECDTSFIIEKSEVFRPPVIAFNSSLGSLMNAYGSDVDSEDELSKDILQKSCDNSNSHSDINIQIFNKNVVSQNNAPVMDLIISNENDSEPEEVKIERNEHVSENIIANEKSDQSSQIINAGVKSNNKRRKKHMEHISMKTSHFNTNKRFNRNVSNNQFNSKRRITLLERLLSNEIKHERNVILQCVNYIVKNDYFENK